ncbi:hypothetical protein M752DRAFT_47632 [Aspergillus phoenicis ATCC 13157]|uniref:Uncharacterized protein n=1 Tax=Aspergillus phoenicis ATCC 13157 TaxID=1353007 RepID=A0A370PCZ7_ASPPH|nr:hypothetical protein M752DRAFT_47632 [Aspergillus phoenicis ATCC 13157]
MDRDTQPLKTHLRRLVRKTFQEWLVAYTCLLACLGNFVPNWIDHAVSPRMTAPAERPKASSRLGDCFLVSVSWHQTPVLPLDPSCSTSLDPNSLPAMSGHHPTCPSYPATPPGRNYIKPRGTHAP